MPSLDLMAKRFKIIKDLHQRLFIYISLEFPPIFLLKIQDYKNLSGKIYRLVILSSLSMPHRMSTLILRLLSIISLINSLKSW